MALGEAVAGVEGGAAPCRVLLILFYICPGTNYYVTSRANETLLFIPPLLCPREQQHCRCHLIARAAQSLGDWVAAAVHGLLLDGLGRELQGRLSGSTLGRMEHLGRVIFVVSVTR